MTKLSGQHRTVDSAAEGARCLQIAVGATQNFGSTERQRGQHPIVMLFEEQEGQSDSQVAPRPRRLLLHRHRVQIQRHRGQSGTEALEHDIGAVVAIGGAAEDQGGRDQARGVGAGGADSFRGQECERRGHSPSGQRSYYRHPVVGSVWCNQQGGHQPVHGRPDLGLSQRDCNKSERVAAAQRQRHPHGEFVVTVAIVNQRIPQRSRIGEKVEIIARYDHRGGAQHNQHRRLAHQPVFGSRPRPLILVTPSPIFLWGGLGRG